MYSLSSGLTVGVIAFDQRWTALGLTIFTQQGPCLLIESRASYRLPLLICSHSHMVDLRYQFERHNLVCHRQNSSRDSARTTFCSPLCRYCFDTSDERAVLLFIAHILTPPPLASETKMATGPSLTAFSYAPDPTFLAKELLLDPLHHFHVSVDMVLVPTVLYRRNPWTCSPADANGSTVTGPTNTQFRNAFTTMETSRIVMTGCPWASFGQYCRCFWITPIELLKRS